MKIFLRNALKWKLRLLGPITVILCALKIAPRATDTFTILGISSSRPYNPAYKTHPLSAGEKQELHQALGQHYRYFGRGGQAYVFLSDDNQYVIKFFKQRLFKPSWWLNHIPLPPFLHTYRAKRNFTRADKLRRDFFSYRTSFDQLQEMTEVIYCHLNPTNTLKTRLNITDRLGICHHLNLDDFDFLIQRRATRVYDQIDHWMAAGESQAAARGIGSIFSLISRRALLGLRDRDPNIRTNCGFIQGRAIKIDVGRLVIDDSMRKAQRHNADLIQITAPFKQWIRDNHPALIPSFEQQLQETLLSCDDCGFGS